MAPSRGRGAPRNKKVTAAPLAGGGASGGALNIDLAEFRDQIRAGRDAGTAMSVSDGLLETMSALDLTPGKKGYAAPTQQFIDSLQRVAVEHERNPGENVIEPYRQAFLKLMEADLVKADSLLNAAQLPDSVATALVGQQQGPLPPGGAFGEDVARKKMETLSPQAKAALLEAQEVSGALQAGRQLTLGQEPAAANVEGMQQLPLAQSTVDFDDTRQGKNLIGALTRLERSNPEIAGLVDAGTAYAPAPEDPPAPITRDQFPYSLSQMMGSRDLATPLYYRDDQAKTPQQIFYPLIKPVHNIRLLREWSGKPFVESLPPFSTTVGKLNKETERPPKASKGKLRVDKETKAVYHPQPEPETIVREGSVGPAYEYDVGQEPAVAQALSLIDKNVKPNPRFDPANPQAINPQTGQPYLEFTYPAALPARIKRLLSAQGAPEGGRVMLRYGTRPMSAAGERRLMGEGRGPMTRRREQLVNIIEGQSASVPKALQRLIGNKDAAPDLKAMVERAAVEGGILPLDEVAPYWRGNFTYIDPSDGQLYYGKLPPDILAPLIAQQLLIDNPGTMQSMVGTVRRAMEIYEQVEPSGRALKYMDESGAPQTFSPSKPYMEQIIEFYRSQGQPIPEIQMRESGLKRPGADQTSMMDPSMDPYMEMFPGLQRRMAPAASPLGSLIG